MSYIAPPTVLRIKRKRFQDPLQALVLEDRRAAKRLKPSTPISSAVNSPVATPTKVQSSENLNYIFKLARTDTLENTANDATILQSVLLEAGFRDESQLELESALNNSNSNRKRKFIIPMRQTEEDVTIPNELSDMLSSFLSVGKENAIASPVARKKRTRGIVDVSNEIHESSETPEIPAVNEASAEEEQSEYVYDVYQLTSTEPLTTANHPQSQIGYIRFFDDDDDFYESDQDETNKPTVFSDDEDSNAEDFYQNDYPSDEDAGAYSETNSFEVEDDDEDQEDEYGIIAEDGVKSNHDNDLELADDEIEDYGEIAYLEEDKYYVDTTTLEDEDFKRNRFFEDDEDNELAIHRDRIFGRLEKMINEND